MKKWVWVILLSAGCIDPYLPPELTSSRSILVIDGHIDPNQRSTIILSKSLNLDDTKPAQKVTGAQLWVESEGGTRYPLLEETPGVYALAPQSFSPTRYRLFVRTADAREYVSDFVEIKNSPPIDSISWKVTSDLGIEIYANTHHNELNTGYYRWKFEETWKYTTPYQSIYIYDLPTRSIRLRDDDIFHCWKKNASTDILVASTSRLSENRISEFPLTYIEQRAERLRMTYSILVTQYAITAEAYDYWQQLKKTTEDLGTLFGPLPSLVSGNFTCLTQPDEPVLGFFSMGTTTQERIFITSLEVPRPHSYNLPYQGCELYELPLSDVANFSPVFLLAGGIPNPNGPGIIGYYYAVPRCIDCRLSGGTNVKPSYWP
jgi:hypothetical protein